MAASISDSGGELLGRMFEERRGGEPLGVEGVWVRLGGCWVHCTNIVGRVCLTVSFARCEGMARVVAVIKDGQVLY